MIHAASAETTVTNDGEKWGKLVLMGTQLGCWVLSGSCRFYLFGPLYGSLKATFLAEKTEASCQRWSMLVFNQSSIEPTQRAGETVHSQGMLGKEGKEVEKTSIPSEIPYL